MTRTSFCILMFLFSVFIIIIFSYVSEKNYQLGYKDGNSTNDCVAVIKYAWAMNRIIIIDGNFYRIHMEMINDDTEK